LANTVNCASCRPVIEWIDPVFSQIMREKGLKYNEIQLIPDPIIMYWYQCRSLQVS
jgi:hypothetical protein